VFILDLWVPLLVGELVTSRARSYCVLLFYHQLPYDILLLLWRQVLAKVATGWRLRQRDV